MSSKKVLLIIASEGYQPVEYGFTRRALENAGIKVMVACDKMHSAAMPNLAHTSARQEEYYAQIVSEYPQYATAPVDMLINTVNPAEYDGIFIIGGSGAMEFLDNTRTYDLVTRIAENGKPFGAICISPRILAKAGVLKQKKATGWDGDHNLEKLFAEHKVVYVKEPVVIDGNLITADGPPSAHAFGAAIAKIVV